MQYRRIFKNNKVKLLSDDLKSRINKLEIELDKKELEIHELQDKIELLEDNMMKYEEIDIEEVLAGKHKVIEKLMKAKLAVRVKSMEKENRDLKNKLGFFRKEKIQLQKELENFKKPTSSVIKIDEMAGRKKQLNSLVADLQGELNKKNALINKLKRQVAAGSGDASEILKEKDEEIEALKSKLSELTEKSEESVPLAGDGNGGGTRTLLTRGLTEDLQDKLNKTRRQVDHLKKKLKEYETGEIKVDLDKDDAEITTLKAQIEELKKELEFKATLANAPSPAASPMSSLTAELQDKMNKLKVQVKNLQEKLKEYQAKEKTVENISQEKLIEEINMQKEKITLMQQKIDEQQRILSVKEQRIISLSNQVKTIGSDLPATALWEDTHEKDIKSHVALRLRELKSVVEDLKKQNIQQRLEISQLRKT